MIKEILETIYNNEIYKDSSKKHKKTDVQKLHKVLENLILDLNDAYYNKSQSLIEDREYDDLLKTYEDLCEKYKLKNKISVGATSPHAKISHNTPMLSLSNSYNKQDILQFMKRHPAIEYSCELKLDGVSFNLIYEDGVLAKAITRGDGKIGESIMHNLPDTIPTRIDIKDDIEVRGEFFLYRDQFARINEERAKMKLPLFANPRNTVSGIIRSIEKSPIQAQYIIYGTPNELRPTQEETLQYLKQLKFNINDRGVVCRNIDEIERYYNQILSERDGLNYEIDGIVVKINNLQEAYSLENNERCVKHSIAYKFPAICGKTEIEEIVHNVGRSGSLTPVAIVKPVYVGGVTIRRVTLHNIDFITSQDIRVGDQILLERAGDVIPKVKEVLTQERKSALPKYEIPTICPSCKSTLVDIECINKALCPSQRFEYMKYFIKVLKIANFGPKLLEKLMENNIVNDIFDILDLKNKNLSNIENFGDISMHKLVTSIEKSKRMSVSIFIESLGIPEIGSASARIISNSIERDISKLGSINFAQCANIGDKLNDNIHIFYKSNHDFIMKLWNIVNIEEEIECPDNLKFLQNKEIGLSGSFIKNKDFYIKHLAQFNITLKKSFSKHFDLLILGENSYEKLQNNENAMSGKVKIAQEYSIQIVTEQQILDLLKG